MPASDRLLRAFAGREEELLARVSHMYFVKGMTQEQIAEYYNVSRFKILRLIEKAKSHGIVRIEILSPQGSCLDLEKKLKALGLKDSIVAMPLDDSPASRLSAVCQSAASFLYYQLPNKKCLGLTWGRTVANTLDQLAKLRPEPHGELTVVPLMGGIGKGQFSVSSVNLVSEVARLYGAESHFILSPCIVDSTELRDYFVNEAGNAHTLQHSRNADIALMGIGSNTSSSGLVLSGLVSGEQMERLIRKGSVGNTCAHFYDIEGDECSELMGRSVALSMEEMKRLPLKIGVASGSEKVLPIVGAIKGGFVDVLITDQNTALELLGTMEGM